MNTRFPFNSSNRLICLIVRPSYLMNIDVSAKNFLSNLDQPPGLSFVSYIGFVTFLSINVTSYSLFFPSSPNNSKCNPLTCVNL